MAIVTYPKITGQLTSDSDAIDYLTAYVRAYGEDHGWGYQDVKEIADGVYDAGHDWVDDYADALLTLETMTAERGVPDRDGIISVGIYVAESLGLDYSVGVFEVVAGTVTGSVSDVAAAAGAAKGAALEVSDKPYLYGAVALTVLALVAWIKR